MRGGHLVESGVEVDGISCWEKHAEIRSTTRNLREHREPILDAVLFIQCSNLLNDVGGVVGCAKLQVEGKSTIEPDLGVRNPWDVSKCGTSWAVGV